MTRAQQMLNTKEYVLPKNHYKIRGRSDFDWSAYDQVRFEVSLHSNQHEGAKVGAIAEWLHRHFKHVVILVGDSLHRHNYMINKICSNMEDALSYSAKAGEEWKERNAYRFYSNTPIVSWGTLLQDPAFFKSLEKSRYLYNNNIMFHDNVNNTIQEKWRRMLNRNEPLVDWAEFKSISLNYLLEETAGLAIAYKKFPGVSAYPGEYNNMWSMFTKNHIDGAPEGLENAQCIRLCINKRKAKTL